MLLQRNKSCLLVIDVQEKLTPHVQQSEALEQRCSWLMRLANTLSVPMMVSEQYPSGLGRTLSLLRQAMPGQTEIEKVHFSCYRDASFIKHWRAINKPQVLITGIETHVCVLQTALEMNTAGIEVFVVVDAVSSRKTLDHEYALQRMSQSVVNLMTSEMVLFEWIEQAGTPLFKSVSQAFLK
jgi:nicotinamidase-related amidase